LTVAACRIYAGGTDVVWSKDALRLPLPADIHAEPLDARLVVAELPTLTEGGSPMNSPDYPPMPKSATIRTKP
jgi:hypothetical protein